LIGYTYRTVFKIRTTNADYNYKLQCGPKTFVIAIGSKALKFNPDDQKLIPSNRIIFDADQLMNETWGFKRQSKNQNAKTFQIFWFCKQFIILENIILKMILKLKVIYICTGSCFLIFSHLIFLYLLTVIS